MILNTSTVKKKESNGSGKGEVLISKVQAPYQSKSILIMIDEMNEIANTSNYKAQTSIMDSINSIARLGRAANCNMVLAAQRASGDAIPAQLKNNIACATILGACGPSESSLVLEEDYSDLAEPEIKGRGLIETGTGVIKYQSFFIPDSDKNKWTTKASIAKTIKKKDKAEKPAKEESAPKVEEVKEVEEHPDEEEELEDYEVSDFLEDVPEEAEETVLEPEPPKPQPQPQQMTLKVKSKKRNVKINL